MQYNPVFCQDKKVCLKLSSCVTCLFILHNNENISIQLNVTCECPLHLELGYFLRGINTCCSKEYEQKDDVLDVGP